jgi:hypothetical protein
MFPLSSSLLSCLVDSLVSGYAYVGWYCGGEGCSMQLFRDEREGPLGVSTEPRRVVGTLPEVSI